MHNSRNPRVALVLTQLGYGGAEKQAVELVRQLSDGDHRPCLVICLSNILEPYGPRIEAMGYPLEVLSRRRSFDAIRVLRLSRILRAYKIDLAYGVHLLASGYSWLACKMGAGAAFLPSFRGNQFRPGLLRSPIYRAMLRDSKRILVNSHSGVEVLRGRFNVPHEKFAVVSNGFDFVRLREAAAQPRLRKELGIPADQFVIGFVGKDSRVKNVPRFLRILRKLLRTEEKLHGVLVGSGLNGSSRESLAPDLPLERVHFLGTRQDVPALMADMDCLVLTSDSEGCPNVVLEALAVGTPVVAANVGDVAKIVRNGETGAVVPPHAVDDYVQHIGRLLRSRCDNKTRISKHWAELESEYGLNRMVESTVGLWRELAGNAEAARAR